MKYRALIQILREGVKTKDGAVYIEILTVDDIKAIKNSSRGKNGPWSGPFEKEMWKKSAIRRLSKRLPMSTDLEGTIQADDEMYSFEKEETQQPDKDVTPKPNRLEALLEKEKEQEPVVEAEVVEDEPEEDLSPL